MKKRILSLVLTVAMLASLCAIVGTTASAYHYDRTDCDCYDQDDCEDCYYCYERLNRPYGSKNPWYYSACPEGYYYSSRYNYTTYSESVSASYGTNSSTSMTLYAGANSRLSGKSFRNRTMYLEVLRGVYTADIGISNITEPTGYDVSVNISRVSGGRIKSASNNGATVNLENGWNVYQVDVDIKAEPTPMPLPIPTPPTTGGETGTEPSEAPGPETASVEVVSNSLLEELIEGIFGSGWYPTPGNRPGAVPEGTTRTTFYVRIYKDYPASSSSTTSTKKYEITASAGLGGSVSKTSTTVSKGGSATISFTPDFGYAISRVVVDGQDMGIRTSYTFNNVSADHDVKVYFTYLYSEEPEYTPVEVIFSDVNSDHWYFKYVSELSGRGLVSGYPDGSYKPFATVTWGEALKLVMLASGYSEQAALPGQYWASGYMQTAINDGILDKEVNLRAPIDRNAIASLAANALGLGKPEYLSPFADNASEAAIALYEANIITGSYNDAGKLVYKGEDNLNRAAFAAIIYRMITRVY